MIFPYFQLHCHSTTLRCSLLSQVDSNWIYDYYYCYLLYFCDYHYCFTICTTIAQLFFCFLLFDRSRIIKCFPCFYVHLVVCWFTLPSILFESITGSGEVDKCAYACILGNAHLCKPVNYTAFMNLWHTHPIQALCVGLRPFWTFRIHPQCKYYDMTELQVPPEKT